MKIYKKVLLLLSSSALVVACDNHGDGGHSHDEPAGHASHGDDHEEHGGHGHGDHGDHGAEATGITRYTDKLELFAEHPPAIASQEFGFLAHLTVLKGFGALENATVTLVLDGPEKVQAQVTKNLRPGIFKPTLKAPAAGKYQASLVVTGPDLEDTIRGFEITVYSSAEAAHKQTEQEQPGGAEPISFLKEQQWQIPFGTAFASEGSVMPTVEVAGEVTTPPAGQADVGAAISGRLVAPPEGLAHPGQAVKKGQLLATIAAAPAAPEDAARAGLAVIEAEARVEKARATLERAERLIADKAIAQREVDDARRELAVAEKTVTSAKSASAVFSGAASGSGAGTYRITSPIDGIVVELNASSGKSVTSGELLFRVMNLSSLWLKARVPEQAAVELRADQNAAYKLSGHDTWYPISITGDTPSASVVNIARTVDKRSRTVEVIYALTDPNPNLRVGAMVRVAVPSGEPWQGVVVPQSALLSDNGRSLVYVQLEGEAFEERAVTVGPRAGALTGIVKGISVGERVVTTGANVVRLSSRASSTPAHGHVH